MTLGRARANSRDAPLVLFLPASPLGPFRTVLPALVLSSPPPLPLTPPPRTSHAHSGLPNEGVNATGRDFFRGALLTRPDGSATFRTIVPGWYWTRLAHVHLKVRGAPRPPRGSPAGRRPDDGFVTQLFFPPPFLRRVYATGAYAARSARRGDGGERDAYTATVGTDFELRGDGRKFRALLLAPRPATEGWLRANAFAVPPRWRLRQGKGGELGYVASYTLRLRW